MRNLFLIFAVVFIASCVLVDSVGHRVMLPLDSSSSLSGQSSSSILQTSSSSLVVLEVSSATMSSSSAVSNDDVLVVLGFNTWEVQDAMIIFNQQRNSYRSETSFSNQTLSVGAYDSNVILRTLVRFQFPDSLKKYQIIDAKIRLKTQQWIYKGASGLTRLAMVALKKPWDENEVNGLRASSSNLWDSIGVSLSGEAEVGVLASISKEKGDMSDWEFDVDSLAMEWSSGRSNFGVLFYNLDEGLDGLSFLSYPEIYAHEHWAAKGPRLEFRLRKIVGK